MVNIAHFIKLFGIGKKDLSLEKFQKIINYNFKDTKLLRAALTHDSYYRAMETEPQEYSVYERMEFLGDSILGLVVAEHLYDEFPDKPEGFLSKTLSSIVSEKYLTKKASEFKLPEFIILSEIEERNGGREKKSIIADTVESVICAIYFDSGMKNAEKFIKEFLLKGYKTHLLSDDFINYKSILQEYCQERYHETPFYKLISETGPDHNKSFFVNVTINNEECGEGIGFSKKEAQQHAAQDACSKLKIKAKLE